MESVEQLKYLIQLSLKMRESLRLSDVSMKERFEELSAWKEEVLQEQQALRIQQDEDQRCMDLLNHQNQELQEKWTAAQEGLAAKQQEMDEMTEKLKELETIPVLQAQLEMYSSDFYTERADREKLHGENEHLLSELEDLRKQNTQLQEMLDRYIRMQQRHDWDRPEMQERQRSTEEDSGNTQNFHCPKCGDLFPDINSIRLHIMDCIS